MRKARVLAPWHKERRRRGRHTRDTRYSFEAGPRVRVRRLANPFAANCASRARAITIAAEYLLLFSSFFRGAQSEPLVAPLLCREFDLSMEMSRVLTSHGTARVSLPLEAWTGAVPFIFYIIILTRYSYLDTDFVRVRFGLVRGTRVSRRRYLIIKTLSTLLII